MNKQILGLRLMLFGSFCIGSRFTLLFSNIWLKNNKKYKLVKINLDTNF
jgi:hypothetical protein